ncbi:MAG: DUF1232 domain-containing protein [Chloroflexi bacterium]|nr:DUF1232 domain-containing protein [Chloroflexota bacterium]
MSEERKPVVAPDRGVVAQMVRTLQLVWRLLNDSRVSLFPKLIIPAAIVYIISPIDFLPDVILGLGQLDDIGVVMLSIAMFIEFCPRPIVEEHRRALESDGKEPPKSEDVIDGSYRVVPDDERR